MTAIAEAREGHTPQIHRSEYLTAVDGAPELLPGRWMGNLAAFAHDHSFADDDRGRILAPGSIIDQTLDLSHYFLGETPLGPRVFGIVPTTLRVHHHGEEAHVPTDSMFAMAFAKEAGFLRAVIDFHQRGLLSEEQARKEAGGHDPYTALGDIYERRADSRELKAKWLLRQNPSPRTAGPLTPIGAIGMGISMMALVETAKAYPPRDERGRPFRRVRRAMYMTAAGLVIGQMILSACTPAVSTPQVRPTAEATASQVAATATATNPATPTHEALPTPTELPGGPDDENATRSALPWPSSLSEILKQFLGGGENVFDISAANVQDQLRDVKKYLSQANLHIVEDRSNLINADDVFVTVVQNAEPARWAVAGVTLSGFVVAIDKNGNIMDRPDWATTDVSHYEVLPDGYGKDFLRNWELVNDHWVPVVRDAAGNLVAFYDINKGEFVRASPELGGEKTSIVFAYSDGKILIDTLPSQILPEYLVPTTPEEWKSLTMPTWDDGTPISWGALFRIKVSDNDTKTILPVRIRGVVEIPNPGGLGGTFLFPILEIPAQGGSFFVIPAIQRNRYSSDYIDIYTMTDGIPAQWQNHPTLDVKTFFSRSTFILEGLQQFEERLERGRGQVAIIIFEKGRNLAWDTTLEAMARTEFVPGNVSAITNIPGLIIP